MLSNKIYLWLLMSVTLTLQAMWGQAANASEVTEVVDSQVNSEKTYLAQTGNNLSFADDLAQVTSISQCDGDSQSRTQ
jgi:hypothetical protein